MEPNKEMLEKDTQIAEAGKNEPANAVPAYEAAEADIAADPDMNLDEEEGDDLDEGELAQLEGEE